MKTVGPIRWIGPESTIAYYRISISSRREREGDDEYPQAIINSMIMEKMLDLMGASRLKEAAA